MGDSVKDNDRRLAEISAAIGKKDWITVRNLSKEILALDRGNAAAKEFLKLSKQRMQNQSGSSLTHPEGQSLTAAAEEVFVGRREEIDRLEALVEKVISGRGRMVMIAGEPGIGKTRIAEELHRYARSKGVRVLWGKCYEGQGAPAYWQWVQVLRSYVREQEAENLRSEMGAGAPVIAELIPEVHEKLSDLPHPPALDNPESSRFRLFDATVTFLKNASKSEPLVLILDDLHWADSPSLIFLEFVAHELMDSRLLVSVASVVGESFTATLLARLIEVLEEALLSRIVEEHPDAVGHYKFAHALIQQTLVEELTITRRVRLHARIGQASRLCPASPMKKPSITSRGVWPQGKARRTRIPPSSFGPWLYGLALQRCAATRSL